MFAPSRRFSSGGADLGTRTPRAGRSLIPARPTAPAHPADRARPAADTRPAGRVRPAAARHAGRGTR
ncbi:hypothetical protein Sru01_56760 [Sphaerisporangium rufum]|uniref:Uncharacterized protein n=1 Tax=Sphaerisporangium rufum TaxID=1381558 RepID=A0A919R6T9_9ACTN|nr:hypothetical protein Sru01_56760 [Sphaerisporangium rufum]